MIRTLLFTQLLFLWGINTVSAQTDSVTVQFEVVVPEHTPENADVFWAGSLNNWDPGPYESVFSAKDHSIKLIFEDGIWKTELSAVAGTEVIWKYTRGSVYTVEEEADYTYKSPRKTFFDSAKVVRDTVHAWHDLPPPSIEKNWPVVNLKPTNLTFTRNGTEVPGLGQVLYDKSLGAKLYNLNSIDTRVHSIPESDEHVFYFIPIFTALEHSTLVAALKNSDDTSWKIYIDKNQDRSITDSEFAFDTANKKAEWRGPIVIEDKASVLDTVHLSLKQAVNLPRTYRSSASKNAPKLIYTLPIKHRTGTLNGNVFNVSTGYGKYFSDLTFITIDNNADGHLEIGSGSLELKKMDDDEMRRTQSYYIHPSFKLGKNWWEIAFLDPYGKWIRLRPSFQHDEKEAITLNAPAPNWKSITNKGNQISNASLKGKYVLLDFWGSWCGPCIDELPTLKKAYQLFPKEHFEIVGFAYENLSSLNTAVKNYDITWPQVLDEYGSYNARFLVSGFPTYYLVNPQGMVVEMGNSLRGKNLIPTLKKYLGVYSE